RYCPATHTPRGSAAAERSRCPLGRVLHQDLRARSLAERELVGAPEAPLIASAVAATFAGVLADWLHGLVEATPEEIAHKVWRLLVALHASR
ncbi:hypothetical protein ACWD4T_34410, partial [Streptomyces umbrinus]